MHKADIFDRLKAGELVPLDDPEFFRVTDIVNRTLALSPGLNTATTTAEVRERLGEITGTPIDESTTIFAPLYTNMGCFLNIGKRVFINHACSFLDMGGITIEDDVMIGPRVNLVTENHPLDPGKRKAMLCAPVLIKRNAWIGAGATILPGVTIGENAVIAAGAVVNRDVPANTVAGGIPAKIIKPVF